MSDRRPANSQPKLGPGNFLDNFAVETRDRPEPTTSSRIQPRKKIKDNLE
jgi:hypothetical protein